MKMRASIRTLFAASLGMGLGMGAMGAAQAATATGNMTVTATVSATCTVTGSTLAFGAYVSAAVDNTANMTVNCTNSTPYTVSLDAGAGAGATTSVRKMTSGGNTLNYTLFRDAGRTQNWGAVIGTDKLAGTGTGANQTVTVYGRITAAQTVAAGAYTDTVGITITY
jgi:spore coat protein U-like protein